jgi:hypothetical protein
LSNRQKRELRSHFSSFADPANTENECAGPDKYFAIAPTSDELDSPSITDRRPIVHAAKNSRKSEAGPESFRFGIIVCYRLGQPRWHRSGA